MKWILLFTLIVCSILDGKSQSIKYLENNKTLTISNFSNLDLEKLLNKYKTKSSDTIDISIKINNSTIAKTYLSNLIFTKELIFDSVIFLKPVYFSNVTFKGNLIFNKIVSKKNFSIDNSNINKEFMLTNSKINRLYLWGTYINLWSIDRIEVSESFSLTYDSIKNCMIHRSNFNGEISYFGLKLDYASLVFNNYNEFNFTENTFFNDSSSINFFGTSFNGKTYFSRNQLPKRIDFSNVSSRFEIDLVNSVKDSLENKIVYINLQNSDIQKIRLMYMKPFVLLPPNYGITPDELNGTYLDLLEKQKEDGFYNSYVKLDKEYKNFYNLIVIGGVVGHISNFAEKYWWGYGHEKQRIIFHTLTGIFIFWLISWGFFESVLMNGYSIQYITERFNDSKNNSKVGYIITRSILSLFYVLLIFFGFHLNFDKLKFRNLKVSVFIGGMYFYGLICTAFLVNYLLSS